LFRNPLFLALGVRITQPDAQTVILRLPWSKTQKLLASEIPMAIVVGCAEMVLQLHLRQFQVFSPVRAEILGVEVDLPRPLAQPIEIRMRSTWPEWEELRLSMARTEVFERDFVLPLWNGDGRTLGTVKLRVRLESDRLLTS
jgi:hypothetical protein